MQKTTQNAPAKKTKDATDPQRETQLAKSRAAIQLVVATVGSQAELGAHLGVTQAAVSKWVVRGWVSPSRAREMEALTGVSRNLLVDPRVASALLPVEMGAA